MKNQVKIASFVIILLSSSSMPNFALNFIYGEEEHIPSWISHTARWNVQGKITNSEYNNTIKYLLNHGFISKESAEELLELVQPNLAPDADDKCRDRNFPIVNWSNCDFSEANLNHINLHNSNLSYTNFEH